ncbi:MAG: COX15/CtaA family protein [Planctomycetes bacterium]|nr:COX15/CtaA family protein [Planctomycetota bacterium]
MTALSQIAPSSAPAQGRGPFRLAVATVFVVILTILKGAMTTSTGSGMAFSDWPLSDGELMPERSYTTLPGFFEHFHRLAGATAGFCSLLLTVLVLRDRGTSQGVRRLAIGGLSLIIVQGVIGGVGVLKNLPMVTSVTHGTLAQVTLAVFAVLAFLLSARWRDIAPVTAAVPGCGRKIAAIAVAFTIAQTVMGAIARHGDRSHEHMLWGHVGNAFVVFLVVVIAAGVAVGKLGTTPGIRGLAQALVGMLIGQIALGFVALVVRTGKSPENVNHLVRASLISAHVLLGALLTVATTLLAAHVWRASRREPGGSA